MARPALTLLLWCFAGAPAAALLELQKCYSDPREQIGGPNDLDAPPLCHGAPWPQAPDAGFDAAEHVAIRVSGAKGVGVYAVNDIPANTCIGVYVGTNVTDDEWDELSATATRYSMHVDDGSVIIPSWLVDSISSDEDEVSVPIDAPLHWTARMNHAAGAHENVQLRNEWVYRPPSSPAAEAKCGADEESCAADTGTAPCAPGEARRERVASFYTKRDIKAGEELAFDYSFNYWIGHPNVRMLRDSGSDLRVYGALAEELVVAGHWAEVHSEHEYAWQFFRCAVAVPDVPLADVASCSLMRKMIMKEFLPSPLHDRAVALVDPGGHLALCLEENTVDEKASERELADDGAAHHKRMHAEADGYDEDIRAEIVRRMHFDECLMAHLDCDEVAPHYFSLAIKYWQNASATPELRETESHGDISSATEESRLERAYAAEAEGAIDTANLLFQQLEATNGPEAHLAQCASLRRLFLSGIYFDHAANELLEAFEREGIYKICKDRAHERFESKTRKVMTLDACAASQSNCTQALRLARGMIWMSTTAPPECSRWHEAGDAHAAEGQAGEAQPSLLSRLRERFRRRRGTTHTE